MNCPSIPASGEFDIKTDMNDVFIN